VYDFIENTTLTSN